MTVKFGIVALFVLGMVYIGYVGYRKTKSLSDFFLGGRTIGPWLSAFTYCTTYFSAVIFIGFAGKIGYAFGYSALWIPVGNTLIGTFLAWYLLARRTHAMTVRLNSLTMPEFFEARYQSQFLKLYAALVIFIFLVPYSASVYIGLSHLFEVNLGIPYAYALTFMAILTAIYLISGGYHAIVLTDVIQGTIMLVGAVVMVIFIVMKAGGPGAAAAALHQINPQLTAAVGPPGLLALISLVALTSLGPWGLPQMVQKFYSVRNQQIIRTAMVVATLFSLVITFSAYYTGSFTRIFCSPQMTPELFPEGKPAFDKLVPYVITYAMPNLLGIVILLLVLSASMSTLSSLVLVSSSAIAVDLVGHVGRGKIRQETITTLMRLLCGLFIALSVFIALRPPEFIVTLMSISWGTVAGSFLAPFLLGLYWKGTTKMGAIVGSVSGLVISIVLFFYWGAPKVPLAGSIAMVVPLAVVFLVSLVTPKFDTSWLNQIFSDSEPARVEK